MPNSTSPIDNVDEIRTHWPTLVAGAIALAADGFDLAILGYLLPYIRHSFGVSLGVVSFLLVATTSTRWLGALVFGALAGRFGRKPLLIASVAWIGLLTVASGLAPNYTLLLVIRLAYGMGVGGVYATAGALIREGAGRRGGLASGIFIFGWFGGQALSPLFFYEFLPRFGWRGAFVSEGVVLVLIPYLVFGLRESKVWLAASRTSAAEAPSPVIRRGPGRRPFWQLFTPAGYLAVTLMLVCLEYGNFFSSSSSSLLPTYLHDHAHLSPGQIALIGSVSSFVAMPGSLLGGWLCDVLGRRRTFRLLFAVIWIPVVITFIDPAFAVLIICWALFGLLNGALGGSLAVFETEQYPTELRSAGYGFAHNLGSLGGSFGSVIAAFLAAFISLGPALTLMTMVGVFLGLLAMVFARETVGRSLITGDVIDPGAPTAAASRPLSGRRASGSRGGARHDPSSET